MEVIFFLILHSAQVVENVSVFEPRLAKQNIILPVSDRIAIGDIKHIFLMKRELDDTSFEAKIDETIENQVCFIL
jgi:hypothetical protein